MPDDYFRMKLRGTGIFEFYLTVFEYISMLFTLSTYIFIIYVV